MAHSQSTPSPQQLPLFVLEKRCTECKATKPVEVFSRNRATKDGYKGWCKECDSAHHQAYYAANAERLSADALGRYYANKERRRETSRAWKAANRERNLVTMRAWRDRIRQERPSYWRDYYRSTVARRKECVRRYRERHPERVKERARERRQRNADARRAWYQRWCRDNPERKRFLQRRWVQNHPGYMRPYTALRRARRRQADGRYTMRDVRRLYEEQRGLCAYCGAALEGLYHVEHKQPLARGGSNWPENICCACSGCNLSKGTKTEEEFRAMRARA